MEKYEQVKQLCTEVSNPDNVLNGGTPFGLIYPLGNNPGADFCTAQTTFFNLPDGL